MLPSQGVCKQTDEVFQTDSNINKKKIGSLCKSYAWRLSDAGLAFSIAYRDCMLESPWRVLYLHGLQISISHLLFISLYYAMALGQWKKLQNHSESEPLSKILCPHFLVLPGIKQIHFFLLFLYNDPSSPKYIYMSLQFFYFCHISCLCYIYIQFNKDSGQKNRFLLSVFLLISELH